MLRIIFLLTIFLITVYAEVEKFQVFANNVNTKNNLLVANGNVIIISPTYYITAQKAIYDKDKGTFELFDDVIVLKDNQVQVNSEYTFLDVNNHNSYQKPNLLYDHNSSIWINSKDSKKENEIITLDDTILSSCDCIDPAWSISSSDIEYDTEDKWLNAYNTKLYIKNVPVLYTPYLGFSTDKSRRTGLLIPTFGYSKTEGVSFSQPIFIAPAQNYDFEIIPQLRTLRGSGMYAYYRYADSIDSMLKVGTGYFKEKSNFQKENNLRNKEHYGLEVEYEKANLFTKFDDAKDGIYLSLNYLNDIEYKTLEDKDYSSSNERYIESKINYFYNTPNYYLGSYFRYYIDTQNDSNSKTLQELPKFQAHKYDTSILFDKLLYSADIKYTNHYRTDGIKANQYEVSIPVSYSYSFFDDYLNLILEHEISINKFDYAHSLLSYEDGEYIEGRTTIGLNSDLIKPYENYIHTMSLSANYNSYNEIRKDGDLYPLTNQNIELSPFSLTNKNINNIELALNQSFFDKKTKQRILKHKIIQSIIYDKFNNSQLENLTNLIDYNYIWGNIQNRLPYNHPDKNFIESSSNFSFKYDKYNLNLTHYISQNTPNSYKEDLHSYSIDAKYKLSDRYSFGYYTNYNMEDGIRNKQAFIFDINDKCWSLDIKFEKEITAASTTNQTPIKQDIVYVELMLIPIGGIKQEYEIKRD
jgi:LPS-assembly protein